VALQENLGPLIQDRIALLVSRDVLDIRELQGEESSRSVAKRYEISTRYVKDLWNGGTWMWLTKELLELLEHFYVEKEMSVLKTHGEIIKHPLYSDVACSTVASWIRKSGFMRDERDLGKLSMERLRMWEYERQKEFPQPKKLVPRDLLKTWYVDELLGLKQIQRQLADMGVKVSMGLITRRLHEYGLWESQSERQKKMYRAGKWPHLEPFQQPGKEHAGWKHGLDFQRSTMRHDFPSPLGTCQAGEGKAVVRFRLDFWSEPYVDKSESSHLVVLLCWRHTKLIPQQRLKLKLSADLATGKNLLKWAKGIPCMNTCVECGAGFMERSRRRSEYCSTECSQKARRLKPSICLYCGLEFQPRKVWKGRHFYCSKSCVAKETQEKRGQRLFESRIVELRREGLSKTKIPRELRRRWRTYQANKMKYPMSPESMQKVIKAHEENPDRTEPVLSYRKKK
jgi:hypothetical protein